VRPRDTRLQVAWAITGIGDSWAVVHPVCADYDGRRLVAPSGFLTDLASTPRKAWAIFPPFGRYSAAAILHDYLYATHADADGRPMTRKEADRAFLGLMIEGGTRIWRAVLFHRMVRIFGGKPWRTGPGRLAAQPDLTKETPDA